MRVERINLLIIGVGPNADKTYLPAIQSLQKKAPVTLQAIVDITEARSDVVKRLRKRGFDPAAVRQVYSQGLTKSGKLSAKDITHLDNICRELSINAVIISTEPLAHKAYALWAMQRNLPVLMDKPIVARKNTAHSPYAARALYKDYLEILSAYQNSTAPVFSVAAQRRYHPGFQFVFDKIAEIRDKFDIPVTGMQSLHADGQWRLPNEVITQKYHPYNIYGKVSHSGYHFIDVLAQIIRLSYGPATSKQIDQLSVMTSFVEPRGLLSQLNQNDYARIFGPEYRKVSPASTSDLHQAYAGFGEVDASTIIQLINKDAVVANFTLNLVHNSFSRRSWLMPGEDLYKGNGRVKHEYHSIYQGPFQNIQIHSYQKESTYDPKHQNSLIGGGSHFDVYVFRNADITKSKPLEVHTLHDIVGRQTETEEVSIHDQIKFSMAEEFINFLLGNIERTELVSELETHQLSALIMSLIYQANNAQRSVKHRIGPNLLA
jgi:hypothetical protein